MKMQKKIAALRRERGLTLREAAERCGLPKSTLFAYETGERIHGLKVSTLREIVAAYGITLAQFFAEVPEPGAHR